jgi:hypothetical protein
MPRPKLLVSRRLDRDPSQSMHAQREGEFTSMMQIVLNEMPDHPLACIGVIFSILIGFSHNLAQKAVKRCPLLPASLPVTVFAFA